MNNPKKPIRILWLCHYSLENLRGVVPIDLSHYQAHPATWIHELSKGVCAISGTELHIISVSDYIDQDIHYQDHNLFIQIFTNKAGRGQTGILGKLVRFVTRDRIRRKILRYIKNNTPDIITIHGTENTFSSSILKHGLPTLLWVQGMMQIIYKDDKSKATRMLVAHEASIFRSLKHFITAQPHVQELIHQVNPQSQFYPLFYPVNPIAFTQVLKDESKMVDFGFSGDLLERKGVEDFIIAMGIVNSIRPGIKGRLIGKINDDNYLTHLKKLIKKQGLEGQIELSGWIQNHDELLTLVKHARVFVYPTHADTAPLSLAEAMAAGLPVVSTLVDGIPAMVQHQHNGLLVPVKEVQQLAKAMLDLLENQKKAVVFGENAKSYASAHFEVEAISRNYLQLSKTITGRQ